ncbi:MAG: hypothetical protein PWQ57_518 [Desulfovibrionales bacterium]|nr:hypothetical protein [Desulfovibrionales bacterium]
MAMTRLTLLNMIVRLINVQRYLEIGIAEGNTLARVEAPHRVGVDPSPRYRSMDQATREGLEGVELQESESDHFFFYNNRMFDLIFVDGLHLYEQTMKDILNGFNCLNPRGFVVVPDLIPSKRTQAERDRSPHIWNGDGWKVVFDTWENHPDIGYFVVDSDAGVGVMWKKDESQRFEAAWRPEIRDLSYDVMEKMGDRFLARTPPEEGRILDLLKQSLAERTPLPEGIDQHRRRIIDSRDAFRSMLHPHSRNDGVWLMKEEKYEWIDKTKFHSNFPPVLYRKTVLCNTGGNIYSPQEKVYVLNDATVTPCIKNEEKWPFLWHVFDSSGRAIPDLPQRRQPGSSAVCPAGDLDRLNGAYLYMGWFSPYFGHFLTEVLPRLSHLSLVDGIDCKLLFVAEPGLVEKWRTSNDSFKKFVELAFAHYGINVDDLVFVDRNLRVEKLIAPTPPNVYTMGCDNVIFDVARHIFNGLYGDEKGTMKRLFLSRSRFKGRRLINGEQIQELFKARGFSIVYPEALSFEEQFKLAAGADIIAAEEGSALASCIFAEHPTIIELETGRFHSNLSTLSYKNARNHIYIVPYTEIDCIPNVPNHCMTYAHPWVVDSVLAGIFGDNGFGEALCGPRQLADLLQYATAVSLTGNVESTFDIATRIIENSADSFAPEWIEHLIANLKGWNPSAESEAHIAERTVALLKAFRKRKKVAGEKSSCDSQEQEKGERTNGE